MSEEQFGMYTSTKPSLTMYVDTENGSEKRQFENGVLHATSEEDAKAIDKAIANMGGSGRGLIKKIDFAAAEEIVKKHKEKQSKMFGGASGVFHSLAQTRAPIEEALQERDEIAPNLEASEDFTPTEKVAMREFKIKRPGA